MRIRQSHYRTWITLSLSMTVLSMPQTAWSQPANDNCADATPITDGPTAYSTIGANTDGAAHAECQFDGQTYSDIWYHYQATCTGELTVSTCDNASYDTDLVVYNGCDCIDLDLLGCNDDAANCAGFSSEVVVPVLQDNCYFIRVGGWQAGDEGTGTVTLTCLEEGEVSGACCFEKDCDIMTQADCADAGGTNFIEGVTSCSPNPCAAGAGPDVVYTDVTNIMNYGAVGGIRGYALDSFTCNIGTANLLWGNVHDGTPVLAMNAYRLFEGRLEQVGMSWVKHACCAAAGSGCGIPCNGQGGSVLGVGCRDVYSAGYNGIQNSLGPRSNINAFTGDLLAAPGGTGNAIFKRLQVREVDLGQVGALYFVEGVYVGSDDAQFGNGLNNASYRRVTIGGSFSMTTVDSVNVTVPAIFAWQDHGNGANTPDKSVQISVVDVPDEGRFYVAGKVSTNGPDLWRYSYAIYNLNSHRSGGSFTVPIAAGVSVSNLGFHDVDYHSGEPYSNTDWTQTISENSVTWSSPQTHDVDPNSNALRWATMYTYWFDADSPPQDSELVLGLFMPGIPSQVSFNAQAPSPLKIPCFGDFTGDGVVDAADLGQLLGAWGLCIGCDADLNNDGTVNAADLAQLLGAWGPCD